MRSHRLLKVIAVGLALMAGAVAVRAQGAFAELAGRAGEPLLAYARATHDEGARTLLVNGARLRLRTGSTDAAIETVLDDQAKQCRATGNLLDPIVRTERADQGFIGCIVPRAGQELADRLRDFATTRDLASLGELRATWAMRTELGTRYVMLASDGELKLLDMFPAEGDAPGIDAAGALRPPHTRRLLSTWQESAAPMLVSYRSEQTLEAVAAHYARTAQAVTVPARHGEERVLYLPGARSSLAVLAPDEGGTLISIIPLAEHATVTALGR